MIRSYKLDLLICFRVAETVSHHMPYQIYINCRNHKLALCIKHLIGAFPVPEYVESLMLTFSKMYHHRPKKHAILKEVQAAYGLKNLKMIRAAATGWLSHERACQRLMNRFVQVQCHCIISYIYAVALSFNPSGLGCGPFKRRFCCCLEVPPIVCGDSVLVFVLVFTLCLF